MERAREELHKEALKHKEARENAIKAKCPALEDVSALEEGTRSLISCLTFLILHIL